MTNQDAIYILSGLRKSLHEYCGLNDNAHKAFDMAISALQAQEAKHSSDLISRQAAIDALSTPHGILYPIRTVEELPAAQPELRLSCKNCVHLGHGYMMPCKNCKRNQMLPDWYEVETERKKND